MARTPFSYQNNPNLPNEQYRHAFTQRELEEYRGEDEEREESRKEEILNCSRGEVRIRERDSGYGYNKFEDNF
jgi:hypothetical protein